MNMNIIKSTLLTGLAICFMPVAAQGTSTPYSPGITQDAVSYWLPKTKLTVTVTTRKSTFKPGEFSRYAERYLRMSNVRDKAEEVWEITAVEVSTSGVPDKEHLYTLTFPQKGNRPYFELTDQGILATVNTRIRSNESDASATPALIRPEEKTPNPQDYMTAAAAVSAVRAALGDVLRPVKVCAACAAVSAGTEYSNKIDEI